MTSMRVSATPLITSSLVVGDTGLGVEGVNIPGTGQDGPSVLFQYVTLPADNDAEFRMLVTSQPTTGTLTTYEDGSFVYDAPVPTTDSFNYEWFKDGVSQGSDVVNLTIGDSSYNANTASVLPVLTSALNVSIATPGNNSSVGSFLPELVSLLSVSIESPEMGVLVTGELPALSSSLLLTNIAPEVSFGANSVLPSLSGALSLYNGVLGISVGNRNNIDIMVKSRDIKATVKSRSIKIITKSRNIKGE